jgi:4-diphosphocytidyl-2-C-methyl-D-erythritol kinase
MGGASQAFRKQGMLRMDVYRSGAGFFARAPAKLNLFFEVLAKRADGFHEIETLMVPIGLYDSLALYSRPPSSSDSDSGTVAVSARWASPDLEAAFGPLPATSDNLVTRAVKLLQKQSGSNRGAQVQLTKRIPSAAGLGGGSSDAAAALLLANTAWELGWSHQQLASVAAELGSDVPFFLQPGAAICRGRGEIIEPMGRQPALHYVVVRPPEGLSTPAVFKSCRPAEQPRELKPIVQALRTGDLRLVARHLFNRLEPAAASLTGWIDRLREEFRRVGSIAAQMSGSGSSYFGLCHHARHARRVAAQLRARGLGHVFVVSG